MADCNNGKSGKKREKRAGKVKYRDHKNRVLYLGESQRENGKYRYSFVNANGKPSSVESWKLERTDKLPAGKRPCKSLRELEAEIKKDLNKGIVYGGKKMTLSSLVENYMVGEERKVVKSTTMESKQSSANYIKSSDIGGLSINIISEELLQKWLQKLQDKEGKSHSCLYGYWKILRGAFNDAVDKKIISTNPTAFKFEDYVKKDAVGRKALNSEEKKGFLEFVKNHEKYSQYYDDIYILFYTGLRISELCGITLSELDFEQELIILSHQLQYGNGGYYLTSLKGKLNADEPKTRHIPMLEDVKGAFQRVMNKNMGKCSDLVVNCEDTRIKPQSDFIFLNCKGKPMYAKAYEDIFAKLEEDYNNSNPEHPIVITPHVCRHTFCTALALQGTSPIVLQQIMGHEDIKTTQKYYKSIDKSKVALGLKTSIGTGW